MSTWPIDAIAQLLAPSLAHLGYSIYGLERTGTGGLTLRIRIDKAQGFISIDDCERVSRIAGPLLDQSDLIPDSYTLEVSSPGAERSLNTALEYERFLGHRVQVRRRSGEIEVVLEGDLVEVGPDHLGVQEPRLGLIQIPWDELISGRLVARP
ncbi:MAG TPA: ribosome maturation factor RimP [Candidatus Nitrosotalea sp.]|nr:ribosome maturation factor RimP [Candidatus Nitrosotalea sp.]